VLESLGVSQLVIERARYISGRPEIFKHYPLGDRLAKEDFFTMTDLEQKHAIEILKEVPSLNNVRLQLAPSQMR
jgi:hypothetical protein